MKRSVVFIIALLVAVAAVAGGWYAYRRAAPQASAELLDFVPSDTVLFLGYTRPLPVQALYEKWREVTKAGLSQPADMDPKAAAESAGPAVALYQAMVQQQLAALERGENPYAQYGLPEDGAVGAFYAAGALPVARWRISDADTLWKSVDDAEKRAGIKGRPDQRGKVALRRYAFKTADPQHKLDLVVATGDGFAAVTVDGSGIEDSALDTALGVSRPKENLSEDRLDKLAKRHDFVEGTAGFLDHEELMAALTGAPGNRLGKTLNRIAAAWGASTPILPALRTEACRADANAIAAVWPQTAVGISSMDTDTGRIAQRLVIESNDRETLDQLSRLRGHIPGVFDMPAAFGMGLGLDFASVVPVVQSLTSRFSNASFQCPGLVAIQQQAAQANTAQLGMATAMLADVKGVAAVLLKLKPGTDPGMPTRGDAILSIASERPQSIWNMLQSMVGLGVENSPEVGGPPVALPPQLTRGQRVRVALKPKTLNFLVGDAELPAPNDGAAEALTPNGLLSLRYHYGRLFSALAPAMSEIPADMSPQERKAANDAMESLKNLNASVTTTTDITDRGIEVDMQMQPGD